MGLIRRRRRGDTPANATPDALLPPDHAWLLAGLDDRDLSRDATVRRIQALSLLTADGSFQAAERVVERILAAPIADEDDRIRQLHAEFSYLSSLPKPTPELTARMHSVGSQFVERYAAHPDVEIRAEALMADARLQITDGPTAARWLNEARRRPDFDALVSQERFSEAVTVLERMIAEDAAGGPDGSSHDDLGRILEMLRWWSEPGAVLPARLGTSRLPPAGAIDSVITDDVDAHEVLALAVHLAALARYGDALVCVRSVVSATEDDGRDLARALAMLVEGELLVMVDRVPEAADRLWASAGELYRLGRLDASVQAFLELARLGADHPELDELLIERVELTGEAAVGAPARRGARLLSVVNAGRAIAELAHDDFGMWTANLLQAQVLFALGDHSRARAAILALAPPPSGPARETAVAQAALVRARILLTADGPAAGTVALAGAEPLAVLRKPWFAWQLHLMRAELADSDGRRDDAWSAIQQALEAIRGLRWSIGDEHDRGAWSHARRDVWRLGLKLAGQRDRPAESLAVIEDAKSSHLARIVLAGAASGPDPETAALVQDAMRRFAPRLAGSAQRTRAGPDDARDDEATVLGLVSRRDAQIASALAPPELDADALSRLGDVLGEFLLLDFLDLGDDTLWRVTATRDGAVEVREFTLEEGLSTTLTRLDAAPDPEATEAWIWENWSERELCELGEALLDGVDPRAISSENLVISPSGRLANVPWALLPLGEGIVIDHAAVTLIPSIVMGSALPTRARAPGAPVMMCCDPLGDLNGVAGEREHARELWPGLNVLEGDDTSYSRLVALSESGVLSAASALIWTGHGDVHPEEPLASGLLLGDGSVLTAGRVRALRLPASIELWTCSSGAERRLPSDEQLGLVAACARAGASSVLAGLWVLNDQEVGQLTGHYHDAVARGERPAHALRRAQLACRRENVSASVWGAIVLWGVPTASTAVRQQTQPRVDDSLSPEGDLSLEQAVVAVVERPIWAPPVVPLARLDGQLETVLNEAKKLADRLGSGYVGTGHALWALLHDEGVGPMLSDLGLFGARVESLLVHLPVTEPLHEFTAPRTGGRSQLLTATLDLLAPHEGVEAGKLVSSVLGPADGDARRIVQHCGIDPDELQSWLAAAAIPDAPRWRSYAPSAAALIEADAGGLYEDLCRLTVDDLWVATPWPRRVATVLRARVQDVQRGRTGGRLAAAKSSAVADAERRRDRTPEGQVAHHLIQLANRHERAGSTGSGHLPDHPQTKQAVSAWRTALVVSQAQGMLKLQALCHVQISALLKQRTDASVGLTHSMVARDIATFLGDDRVLAVAEVSLAEAMAGDGSRVDVDAYSRHADRAMELLRKLGDSEDMEIMRARIAQLNEGRRPGPGNEPAAREHRSTQRPDPKFAGERDQVFAWLARFDASGLAALSEAARLAIDEQAAAVTAAHLRSGAINVGQRAIGSAGREQELRTATSILRQAPPFLADAKTALMASLQQANHDSTRIGATGILAGTRTVS